MIRSFDPGWFAVGLVLVLIVLSLAINVGHSLSLWIAGRRWRSRYRVAAIESRRWRRDAGHPGGNVVYVLDRRPDRRSRRA